MVLELRLLLWLIHHIIFSFHQKMLNMDKIAFELYDKVRSCIRIKYRVLNTIFTGGSKVCYKFFIISVFIFIDRHFREVFYICLWVLNLQLICEAYLFDMEIRVFIELLIFSHRTHIVWDRQYIQQMHYGRHLK